MNPNDQELACQYVLDQLSPEERAAFAARLRSEPELRAHVRGLERTLEARVAALPHRVPSPGVWNRIATEVAAETGARRNAMSTGRVSPKPQHAPARYSRWLLWGGLAAAILVTFGLTLGRRLPPPAHGAVVVATLDEGTSTSRRLDLPGQSTAEPEARFVQLAALAEKLWQQSAPTHEGDRGYALFDPASREGFIGIQQAPALRPGQQYRLWVVDERSGEARDAGVLPMREASRGLYFFSLPEGAAIGGKLSFMVTAEPEQSTPAQPKGRVVLGRRF